MRPVFLVAMSLCSLMVVASPRLRAIEDHELQVLYSEIKARESETLRAVITIEVLEEQLHEAPLPEHPEDLFRQLESLYKYYAELDASLQELKSHWIRLLGAADGASVTFTPDQFRPIPILSKKYLAGVPADSIPRYHFPPLLIE